MIFFVARRDGLICIQCSVGDIVKLVELSEMELKAPDAMTLSDLQIGDFAHSLRVRITNLRSSGKTSLTKHVVKTWDYFNKKAIQGYDDIHVDGGKGKMKLVVFVDPDEGVIPMSVRNGAVFRFDDLVNAVPTPLTAEMLEEYTAQEIIDFLVKMGCYDCDWKPLKTKH